MFLSSRNIFKPPREALVKMVEIQHPRFGQVDATDVDFDTEDEGWRDYKLEDGTTLKVKTVVNKVFRIEGMYNELGEPVYEISTQNLVRATKVPEDVKGEPTDPQSATDQVQDQPELNDES